MANNMKQLKVNAENGSYAFDIMDQTARSAAQEAKDAVEKISIPTSLPNPKKLIFTGGATGEYDGSNEVTITIPAAGEGGSSGSGPIKYHESLDRSNPAFLRDLESGSYVLYGYYKPFEGSSNNLTFDGLLANVVNISAGSHILVFSTLNSKVDFLAIEVDSTQTSGYKYERTSMSLLDLNALITKVGNLNNLSTTEKSSLVAAINEVAASQGGGNADAIPTSADLNGTVATFRNSAGVALFTLDMSGLGGSAPVYGNLVLSAEELTITEGQSGTFTVTLDKAPTANQPVYLAVSDGSRLSISPATLTFTPDNWETPQTVTVTSLEDDDEENNTITVNLTSTSVDARQVAVAIKDNDGELEIVTDGLTLFADYTTWDGVSSTISDKMHGVTLNGMTAFVKTQNGIYGGETSTTSIGALTTDDAFAQFVADMAHTDETGYTYEFMGNYMSQAVFSGGNSGWAGVNKAEGTSIIAGLAGSLNVAYTPYINANGEEARGAYSIAGKNFNTSGIDYADAFLHLVYTFSPDGTINIYWNGTLFSTGAIADDFAKLLPVNPANTSWNKSLSLLQDAVSAATTEGHWVSSQRIYNRVLTQDEIVQNMHAEGQRLGLANFI